METTQPIRILHVVTYMGRGGLETTIMNYYRHIDRSKIQFDFLVHREYKADYDDEIRSLGGRIYRLPRLIPWSREYREKLDQFFEEHRDYRIVHCHIDCMASIPLRAAKKVGIPVRIAHSHGSSQNKNLKYLLKLYYRRLIPKMATALFACGKEAGDWMFRGAPYTIMRNAIDVARFTYNPEKAAEIRHSMGLEDAFVLGHVGNFRVEKNHLFLLEIFAALLKKEPNSRLLLVGDGIQMDACVAKSEELRIRDKVLFLGIRSDIPELLQAVDVFVLPSIYEGLPVTTVEAQAAGLPCVVSAGVPYECKLTEPVRQLPLEDGAEAWADVILDMRDYPRENNYEAIAAAGFDIKANAKWLEEYYYDVYSKTNPDHLHAGI